MTLLRCQEILKDFGDVSVLKGVTFEINQEDRIGLVGPNGAGKTTLADILIGQQQPDGGQIIRYKNNLSIGYLRQATSYTLNVFNQLVEDAGGDAGEFLTLTSHLGLRQVTHWDEERFQGLSGGERTKLALADIWRTQPDLLVLDEPTNHMDYQGAQWLIGELKKYQGAAVIISHDRYFLDQATSRTVELEHGKTTDYTGNYSAYRKEKQRRFARQQHAYESEQKQQQKIEEEINRLGRWSDKAHRESTKQEGMKEYYRLKAKKMDRLAKSRIKMLEKKRREGVEKPQAEQQVRFGLDQAEKRGKRVIEARNLAMGYGEHNLFSHSDFFIQRGEKVGLWGPNGSGKTTFIRLLLDQEQPRAGDLWASETLHVGYLSQDVTDLNTDETALEYLGVTDRRQVTQARTLLANMGFAGAMATRPMGQLSLGERTRVKLAGMILQQVDMLILDEPTNHLDLPSRERLEETLADYNGTMLLVTHDRYFLERICDRLLIFDGQNIVRQEMGFSEYMARQTPEANQDSSQQKTIIETRMAWLVNKLSELSPGDDDYAQLDQEFRELAQEKRDLGKKQD